MELKNLLNLLSHTKVKILNNQDIMMDGELYQYKEEHVFQNVNKKALLYADIMEDEVYLYENHSLNSYQKIDNMVLHRLQVFIIISFIFWWVVSLFLLLKETVTKRKLSHSVKRLMQGTLVSGLLFFSAAYVFFRLLNFYICFGGLRSLLLFAYPMLAWIACVTLLITVWMAVKVIRDKKEKKTHKVLAFWIGATSVFVCCFMVIYHMLSFVRGI